MKVLHCITGLTGDGAQRMLLRLAGALLERGITSEVVNLGPPDKVVDLFVQTGIPVSSLGLSPSVGDMWRGVRELRKVAESFAPDLVHGWMYHANLMVWLARLGRPGFPPVLWNIRRGLDDFGQRRLKTRTVIRSNAYVSRGVDSIVYCSTEAREQHENFGFHPARGVVIENGFDAERFRPDEVAREAFRARYNIRDDEFVIGNVGRYDVAKGHLDLLRAFTRCREAAPRARLVCVGRGMTNDNPEVQDHLREHGIRHAVVLLGEQSSIEKVYPGFDALCSASINEGFPNAIAEAMSCGVPCVVTDTGASKRLVDGVGIVVPPQDPSALGRGLREMFARGANERKSLGFAGRQRIISCYSMRPIADKYADLYLSHAETAGISAGIVRSSSVFSGS